MSETASDKPAFHDEFKAAAPVISVEAFYAWKKQGAKERQPHSLGPETGTIIRNDFSVKTVDEVKKTIERKDRNHGKTDATNLLSVKVRSVRLPSAFDNCGRPRFAASVTGASVKEKASMRGSPLVAQRTNVAIERPDRGSDHVAKVREVVIGSKN